MVSMRFEKLHSQSALVSLQSEWNGAAPVYTIKTHNSLYISARSVLLFFRKLHEHSNFLFYSSMLIKDFVEVASYELINLVKTLQ